MSTSTNNAPLLRTGWMAALTRLALWTLLFESITGIAIRFAPFHPALQWSVLLHAALGALTLIPLAIYLLNHWKDYQRQAISDVVLLGYLSTVAIVVCAISGVVVTAQALVGLRTSPIWRDAHLISTFVTLGAGIAHMAIALWRRSRESSAPALRSLTIAAIATVLGMAVILALPLVYSGARYANRFPRDYNFIYGKDRPFAPSLAKTSTGGAFDSRSLAGSDSCGTAGCHSQILAEWKPSAHRYAAMDTIFQGIQNVMARQNGPESTRYCAGCHDPISLFSGSKNLYTSQLTNSLGYQEGVSCLACHSIRKTDVQGNANYTMDQPSEYLWQWSTTGPGRVARDFLIRAYPAEHNRLSRRLFKTPEFCAACHKQFIDQEVNRVGWVQLQNQYDNWAASHWNRKGEASRTVECRECHMPLTAKSLDPAAGDSADSNRSPNDGTHRSHRFLAANNLMPSALNLEGAAEQVRLTEQWLRGNYAIPEIRSKWAEGPVVKLTVETPSEVSPGVKLPIRVVMTSNKVGHDFPTGPLDMIQSWVEISVTNQDGEVIYASGRRDAKNFIEPGTFLFKAEPVDQYGNLIDRHNLWEMVGVRYRRSLFPGYSDTVEYAAACPASLSKQPAKSGTPADLFRREETHSAKSSNAGSLTVRATLHYRKIDQFLLNYVLGEHSGLTAPVVDIAEAKAVVQVRAKNLSGN